MYVEIATLSLDELNKKKRELNQIMFDARMKNALGQLPNPMVIREARRDIARLNTVLRGRAPELAGQASKKLPTVEVEPQVVSRKRKASRKV